MCDQVSTAQEVAQAMRALAVALKAVDEPNPLPCQRVMYQLSQPATFCQVSVGLLEEGVFLALRIQRFFGR
jgi:hypothetical protein